MGDGNDGESKYAKNQDRNKAISSMPKKDAPEGRRGTLASISTACIYTAEALCTVPGGAFYLPNTSSNPISRTEE